MHLSPLEERRGGGIENAKLPPEEIRTKLIVWLIPVFMKSLFPSHVYGLGGKERDAG